MSMEKDMTEKTEISEENSKENSSEKILEAECEKNNPDIQKNKNNRPGIKIAFAVFIITFFAACLYVFCRTYIFNGKKNATEIQQQKETEEKATEGHKRIIVTEKETERITEPSLNQDNLPTESEILATGDSYNEISEIDWKQVVFGDADKDTSVMASQIRISGLPSSIRNLVGFRESDFVRSVSNFLSEYNIVTDKITLQESVPCSSPGAAAYQAQVSGIDDQILSILIYPDYPGYYLFSLVSVSTTSIEASQTRQETQEATQMPQTERTAPPETTVVYQPETTATEAVYDASRLTIIGIPATLLNYIDNRYALQYSLYDYLYRSGYREVEQASIGDYQIDPEGRTATFEVALPGGETLTGNYSLDNKAYSYY